MTTATENTLLNTGTWAIDPAHSSIDFSVRHLMVSKVRGRFETFSGHITVAPDGTPAVTAEIDIASLNTGNAQRDAHVKSPDFFDAANHPVATFASTAVRPNGEAYLLDGNLAGLDDKGDDVADRRRTHLRRALDIENRTQVLCTSTGDLANSFASFAEDGTVKWKPL
jgi:hypothetical protein